MLSRAAWRRLDAICVGLAAEFGAARLEALRDELDRLEPQRPKPVRAVSAKRRGVQGVRVGMIRALVAEHGNICELRACSECSGRAEGGHELVRRSGLGGQALSQLLTDPERVLLACNICNSWVADHERAARKMGLALRRGASEDEQRAAVAAVRERSAT